MNDDDSAANADDADFQRWYFGGSPPQSEEARWPRHAFEEALFGGHQHIAAGEPAGLDMPLAHHAGRVDGGHASLQA